VGRTDAAGWRSKLSSAPTTPAPAILSRRGVAIVIQIHSPAKANKKESHMHTNIRNRLMSKSLLANVADFFSYSYSYTKTLLNSQACSFHKL
jgi:hypothetical protein